MRRWLIVLALLVGCGPVQYVSQVTRRAAAEVAAAKSAGADRYAPYEYTAAIEYLHKAREEAGYADYQAAIRFGNKAEEHAKKAREIALKNGLRYVYTGNVHDLEGGTTRCSRCGTGIIARDWYELREWRLGPTGNCLNCGAVCPGVFDGPPGNWGRRRRPVRLAGVRRDAGNRM